jgi:hypothetical protein
MDDQKRAVKPVQPVNSDSQATAAFLLTAKDKLTAGAYEDMLKKNNVRVVPEYRDMNPYAAISETGRLQGGYNARGARDAYPVNLYVPSEQLERARELVEAFENEPIVYKTPPPVLNRKSRVNQVMFAFIIFFLIIMPIGMSLIVIGSRIFRFLTR